MKIENPKFNAHRELVSFDGMMMDGNKCVLSDPKTRGLVTAIQKLPRISEYTGKSAPRVVIDGKEYALAFKFCTDKEKATYKEYRDAHSGNGSSSSGTGSSSSGTGSSGKTMIPEFLLKELIDGKIFSKLSEESKNFIREQTVDEKRKKLAALMGVKAWELTEEQIKAAELLGL